MKALKRYFLRFRLFVLPVAAAVFLTLAFPPATVPFLIFGAFLPLFYFLDKANSKNAFLGMFIFGGIFFGWIFSWLFRVLPLDWLEVHQNTLAFAVIFIIWFITVSATALTLGLFGFLWKKIPEKIKFIGIPALWTTLEYLRAWIIGIIWYSQDALLGPHTALGSLGYTLAAFPRFLQITKITGLYGAGFLIISLNLLAYVAIKHLLAKNKKQALKPILIIAVICLAIIGYGEYKINNSSKPVLTEKYAILHTNFVQKSSSQEFFENKRKEERELLKMVAETDSETVVLPEGGFINIPSLNRERKAIDEIFKDKKDIKIISSTRSLKGDLAPAETVIYSPKDGIKILGQKIFLVPFGEYLPLALEFPTKLLGGGKWIEKYKTNRYVLKGDKAFFGNNKEGVILCSAVFAPSLWSEALRSDAEILIFPASQWMFRGNFPGQAEAAVRFLAAFNDRWLIKASNGGNSYAIDDSGQIRAKSRNLNSQEFIQVEVEYKNTIPFAVKFEDWPVFASVAILLFGCFSERKKLS